MNKELRIEQAHALLNKEYVDWYERFGNGRNSEDQRFGQWFINNFMPNSRPLPFAPLAFNTEDASDAYAILLDHLANMLDEQK